MAKDIPLKYEILNSQEDEQYRITSRREIEFLLQSLAKNASLIALYPSGSDDFILTTLLKVGNTGLWLEQSNSPEKNKRLTEAKKLTFVSSLAQVKQQFISEKAAVATHDGYPALFLPFPKSIHRLQRREYFRLATPIENPLRCMIPDAQKETFHEATIMDISGGGVGLASSEEDKLLIPGKIYPDCRIRLPDIGELRCSIEVRNVVTILTLNGKSIRRAGCAFKNLENSAMVLLQRYITVMQRTNYS